MNDRRYSTFFLAGFARVVVSDLDGIQTRVCYEIDYLQKARLVRTGTDREATCEGGGGG